MNSDKYIYLYYIHMKYTYIKRLHLSATQMYLGIPCFYLLNPSSRDQKLSGPTEVPLSSIRAQKGPITSVFGAVRGLFLLNHETWMLLFQQK